MMDSGLAVDLGTAFIRFYSPRRGLFSGLRPPMDKSRLIPNMRNPVTGTYPHNLPAPLSSLSDRITADSDSTVTLLRQHLQRLRASVWGRPRVLSGVPSNANSGDIEVLSATLRRAGTSLVKIVPEPLAAALGAGIDIRAPYAQMVVDIGESLTDIAIIRSGRLMASSVQRTACGSFRNAIETMIAEKYGASLSHEEVDRLMRELNPVHEIEIRVRGTSCDAATLEGGVIVNSLDLRDALKPNVAAIAEAATQLLRELPDQAACEVIENGVCLTGGGACLHGIAKSLAEQTNLAVNVAVDPIHAVINGIGQMLGNRSR